MGKRKTKEERINHLKLELGEVAWHNKYNQALDELDERIEEIELYHIGNKPPKNKKTIWIRTNK